MNGLFVDDSTEPRLVMRYAIASGLPESQRAFVFSVMEESARAAFRRARETGNVSRWVSTPADDMTAGH